MTRTVPGGLLPAANVQERMWLAERLEPGLGRYNVPYAWEVRGRLSPAALATAVATVIERHEILRTTFVEHDGRLYQRVDEPWTPSVATVNLRGLPGARQLLTGWLSEQARKPFDIGTNRLLRLGVAELDGDRQVLFLGLHHLVSDAASLPLFLRELRAVYRQPALLPEPSPGDRPIRPAEPAGGASIPKLPRPGGPQ
ncbi:condensation domain-containing protein [Amycolatopsis sp. NPDC049252]|uniref:condensation domain-containing protein n=1 Tax=Amycolatopsis sp. NPDC049252 TaxID=3363933 RepID=UPI0037178A53